MDQTINMSDIRAKFPMYSDLPDYQLIGALHKKFYSDIPRDRFIQSINFDTSKKDPTADMNGAQTLAAGIGKGMGSVARALHVPDSVMDWAGLPKTKEDADTYDAPLMKTTGGKVGNVIGVAAPALPALLIPGANTYAGATAIGALTGGAMTEGDLGDRAKGAAFGALGGAAGKGLGDALGWAVPKIVDKLSAGRTAAQLANAQKDGAVQVAKDAGYVIPPADVNPGMVSELLNGVSGKIKTAQAASVKNQGVTNQMARDALGASADTPLTADFFQAARNSAAQTGYAPVRGFGEVTADSAYNKALDSIASQYQGAARSFPGAAKNEVLDLVGSLRQPKFDAGDALDMVKVLRETADQAYRTGNTGLGKASKAAAGALEDQLDRALTASGSADAIKAFREARQAIAKTYSVQKATNLTTGDVSAPMLAKQLEKGVPLSGDLATIAQVSQAFPKATQALKEAPKAVSPLDFGAALIGSSASGSPMAAAGIAARPMIRSLLLSKAGQSLLANPQSYEAGLLEKLLPSLLASPVQRGLPLGGGLLSANAAQ